MNKWDEKARHYNRYSNDKDRFEQNILKKVQDEGISFANKRVLDIGCGTGVYTLHVAKDALHVDALDSSYEMLQVLEEDAKANGIDSIQTHHNDWDNYKLPEPAYDVALCTMSPAISNEKQMQKMHECSARKIYLGWAGKRDSKILNTIFQAHGQSYEAPNGSLRLKNWLSNHKIPFTCKELDETKSSTRNLEKSIENFSWHLEIRNTTPDKDLIKKLLLPFCDKDGNITEITKSHFNLIMW